MINNSETNGALKQLAKDLSVVQEYPRVIIMHARNTPENVKSYKYLIDRITPKQAKD